MLDKRLARTIASSDTIPGFTSNRPLFTNPDARDTLRSKKYILGGQPVVTAHELECEEAIISHRQLDVVLLVFARLRQVLGFAVSRLQFFLLVSDIGLQGLQVPD